MSEDYIHRPLAYKIRKVLRYTRLYGPSRTLTKVQGQLHMARNRSPVSTSTWENPACRNPGSRERNVAIIGCGNFAFTTIAYYCAGENRRFLRSTYDVNKARAEALCRTYRGARTVASVDEIASDPNVDLVFIASNHATHATYATQFLAAGKDVHIEKPHVVNWKQLEELTAAMQRYPERKVYLGFNRPRSRIFRFIQRYLDQQSGPIMINWFIAGHEIPDDHWYFSRQEGGRILGNICHWTDLTLRLVGMNEAFPVEIIPGSLPESKSDFAITYRFHDDSIASITFSAKGHTFEGVREWLNAHKGDALVGMKDFHSAQIDIREKKLTLRQVFRDHGHRANILNSLRGGHSVQIPELVATASLFLATRDAVESNHPVRVTGGLRDDGSP